MSADVAALPVHRAGAQPFGEAAAQKRQVRHIGCLGDTRRSAHQSHQQQSTHLNAPSAHPELALIIAC
jgi:hypothetical protein